VADQEKNEAEKEYEERKAAADKRVEDALSNMPEVLDATRQVVIQPGGSFRYYDPRTGTYTTGGAVSDRALTAVDVAKRAYWDLTEDEKRAIQQWSTVLRDPSNQSGKWSSPKDLWDYAVSQTQDGQNVWSWFDKAMAVLAAGGDPTGGGSSGGSSGGPRTTTSTSVQQFNEGDAEVSADGAMQDAVGRDASDAEVQAFLAAMNSAAAASPQTTTTTYDAEGNSSSTSSGGINPSAVAEDQAESGAYDAERRDYAGATLMDSLTAAAQAPVDI
jgi:hypothetical protein